MDPVDPGHIEGFAIGELAAAGAAHDLLKVLGVMDCNLEALSAEWLSPQGADAVRSLQAVTSYLRSVRLELRLAASASDSRAAHRPVRLSSWWPDMNLLLHAVHGKGLIVRAEFPQDLPGVCIRPHQLTQVIFKLVNNASQATNDRARVHTEQGSGPDNIWRGEVEISARCSADGQAVTLTIADNGAGMSPAALARAFEPPRADRHGHVKRDLGLATVHRLVSDAGGSIRLSSVAGSGTKVSIELPTRAAQPVGDRAGSAA